MSIVKFNPFHPATINHFVDEVFNRNIGDFAGTDFINSIPAVNIKEMEDKFLVELAAPGMEKSDFNVNVETNQLVISAEKKVTEHSKEDKFTRKEFSYSSFKRTFNLPATVDAASIKAKYENGILNVEIPKKDKDQWSKSVEIG